MKLAIIVAAAKNGVIGVNNQLPWHLPQDLKYFKAVTFGKPVIMGRKTYESIGRPLPGRTNIVITRDPKWQATAGVIVVRSIDAALESARNACEDPKSNSSEAMIIGGAEIYRLTLPLVDTVYLTKVLQEFNGDAHFPKLDEGEWMLEAVIPGEPDAATPHEFQIYRRVVH